MRKPLKRIISPAIRKIHPLYAERVTSHGKVDSKETMADPPAMATTRAGKAQQIKVPVEVNNARKLLMLCCQPFVEGAELCVSLM